MNNELDPYDRKSFDKGQTLHRSAIHAKTSGIIPKGNAGSTGIYDMQGLKLTSNNMSANSDENHHLPNISPNYTTAQNSQHIRGDIVQGNGILTL